MKRGEGVDRDKSRFQEDESIPEKFRAKLLNYVKSGYDRGHMAPAADIRTTQKALDETFLLTNIAPQVGNGFNRDCMYNDDYIQFTFKFKLVFILICIHFL